eukprot:UN33515
MKKGFVTAGIRVSTLEFAGRFVRIGSPVEGWICVNAPADTPIAPVLATIEFAITQDMSAKDLALTCERSGALPKKVSVKKMNGSRIGVVGFEDHAAAELVFNNGITHFGWTLKSRWSKEYLNFRAKERAI